MFGTAEPKITVDDAEMFLDFYVGLINSKKAGKLVCAVLLIGLAFVCAFVLLLANSTDPPTTN